MIEHEAGEVKRLKVRTRHVILVVVVLLAGLGALHLFLSRRSLERRLEALRVAGYPTSFAELAEHTKLPEGTDNAAAVYLRAFAAVKPPADDLNWLFRAKPRRRDKIALWPEPTAEAVADCLAGNQTCLALLHEAGKHRALPVRLGLQPGRAGDAGQDAILHALAPAGDPPPRRARRRGGNAGLHPG